MCVCNKTLCILLINLLHLRKSGRFAKGLPAYFPDISTCDGFQVEGRSDTQYNGYYMSFGTDKAAQMHHGRGYKAKIENLPSTEEPNNDGKGDPKWVNRLSDKEFGTVTLPFSSFSSYWDEKTGKTIIGCSEDDPEYCPTLASLRNIETISFWGEGVEGEVALDVRNIKAVGVVTENMLRHLLFSVLRTTAILAIPMHLI